MLKRLLRPIVEVRDEEASIALLMFSYSLGECAIQGNISAMRNAVPLKECLEEGYLKGPTTYNPTKRIPDDPDIPMLMNKVYPVHEILKADYFMPGCPPPADAIWSALAALLKGTPVEIAYGRLKYD